MSTLTGNVAAANGDNPTSLNGDQISEGNSWDGDSGSWGNGSFVSVDVSLVQGARKADGTIEASDFLLPASGKDLGATTDWSA